MVGLFSDVHKITADIFLYCDRLVQLSLLLHSRHTCSFGVDLYISCGASLATAPREKSERRPRITTSLELSSGVGQPGSRLAKKKRDEVRLPLSSTFLTKKVLQLIITKLVSTE